MAGTELKTSALLTERLKEMTADDAVRMVRQLCVQLEEKKGFHGCIWPGNIRFDEDGKALLGEGSSATAAERSAEQVEFLAPEFFWDDDSSQAADVYSLGLLIYAVCNGGYMPFQPKGGAVTEKDRASALRKRMKGEHIPTPPGMSEQLGAVVRRAMAYKPEQRYASPGELLAALGDTAEALPVPDETVLAAAEAEEKKNAKKGKKAEKPAEDKKPDAKSSEAESKKDDPEKADDKKEDAKPEDKAEDGVKTYEVKKPDGKAGKKSKGKNGEKAAPPENSGDKKPEDGKKDGGFDWNLDEVIALNGLDKKKDDGKKANDQKPQEKKDGEKNKSDSRAAETQDKKYTVRKDFEGSRRRGAPSAAPASRRKRRNSASPIIIALSLVAVVVIGVVAWQLFAPPQRNEPLTPSDTTSPLFVMDENGEMQKTDGSINPDSDANADAQDQELTVVSDTVYAADSGVSLRTGPGTSYPVSQTLSRGTELQRIGVIGGWSLVQYGNGEYYVSSALLSLENPLDGEDASDVPSSVEDMDVEDKQDTVTVASDANLRSGPSTDYDIKGTVRAGAVLQRTGEVNGWSRVLYNGEEVYISNKLIKSAPASATATPKPTQAPAATEAPEATQAPAAVETPAVTQAPDPITDSSDKNLGTIKVTRAVNVRSGPGTDYSILGVAKVGDSFTVSSFIAPKWYQVTYNGQTGYININYVDDSNADVSGVTVTVRVKSAVNIRSGAGADYRIVGTAKTGETFTVVSISDDNWYKIEYNGSTAYVSGKYVTPVT